MRLTLPPIVLSDSILFNGIRPPASTRPVVIPAYKPKSVPNPRLKAELCIFSILFFLNVVKYVVIGGALGCG
jgi:hypothetical protein